jgi:transposase
MLADGASFTSITTAVGCYPDYVSRWKQRFETERLEGLQAKYRGQPPSVRTAALEARVLAKTRQKPPDGSTHWSSRKLAKLLGISHMLVTRIWRRAGYQPHRFERDMASTDPQFEEKAADVLGLYLHPPRHAIVFAVDEKTAIQALDRLDPVLPLSPGRIERPGFEYYRHGTLSLSAALNTRTGEIIGQTVPRHTSAAFVDFLGDIVTAHPHRDIHVIVDNLAAHKTKAVQTFLDAHPRVSLHFTPTYASWLNQVELWFGTIERDLLARGIFKSIPDLARKIRRSIRRYNEDPKPIRWTYNNPAHRITTDSAVTVH